MTSTQSSCRLKNSGRWRTFVIFMTAVFSVSIIVMWVVSNRQTNTAISIMGAGYALLCTGFLAAQLVAFVRTHMDYDQTIEQPKYDMIESELAEWGAQ